MRVQRPQFSVKSSAAPRPAAVVTPRVAPPSRPAAPAGWDRSSYMPPANAPKYPEAEPIARGKRVFSITEAQSKAEARQVGDFFEKYPSRGATQIVFFHSYWAQHQTFQKVPLQAYLYSTTRPVDATGKPKNALWAAYAQAVETGKPQAEVEAAFLRAHIDEFKQAVRTPEFKQLYALATPKYRQVVEAYLDALTQFETQLKAGEDPNQVSRFVFWNTVLWLQRRKVNDNGFMATKQGLKAMWNLKDPLNQQLWGALKTVMAGTVFNADIDQPAPSKVAVKLSAAEARRLSGLTGIPFRAGEQVLTEAMLKGASVAEPERRENAKTAPRRYPLRMSDFLAPEKLHGQGRMAGKDGLMDAREVESVLREVQGRARSQLIQEFYAKYPVPEAGIHLYSANMLAMNGAYGQSEMAATLANAIMPVDNDGKPKNGVWRAYAEAYDRHKATGAPSKETLETLWFRAHMDDFQVVDTPEFQRQLQAFWKQAETDKAFKPLAVYTKAMVGGRLEFEKARDGSVSDESAFAKGLAHFAKTVGGSGTVPFLKHDLEEAGRWFGQRKGPDLDDRGLPTDKALFERTVQGLKEMGGLSRVTYDGLKQVVLKRADRHAPGTMVDLARVLTPAQLKQVDPKVIDFYRNPENYDISAGIHLPGDDLSKLMLDGLGPFFTCLGDIPDRQKGFEGYTLESELYRDKEGRTHWDRYVVVDGERRPLFLAKFEVEGKQLKETFRVHGKDVALYFDVVPHQGGVKLTLDHSKSSRVAAASKIDFTTVPTKAGITTNGVYSGKTGLINGTIELRMAKKA